MTEQKSKSGVWALILKFGSKLLGFLGKSLKLTKAGLAVASFASYSVLFTWKFALLIMLAVGFHEASHVFEMRRQGMKTSGWYFLPFLGGVALAEENYKEYWGHVRVALAGPVGGTLLAIATYIAYLFTHNNMLCAAACYMAVLNLINLLPTTPLDGGWILRGIMVSINKSLNLVFMFVSLALAAFLAAYTHIWLFFIFIIISGVELFFTIYHRNRPWADNSKLPKQMNSIQILLSIVGYVGFMAILFLLVVLTRQVPGADIAENFLK